MHHLHTCHNDTEKTSFKTPARAHRQPEHLECRNGHIVNLKVSHSCNVHTTLVSLTYETHAASETGIGIDMQNAAFQSTCFPASNSQVNTVSFAYLHRTSNSANLALV